MEIIKTKKATITVTNEEYRTVQTFCKWLNDNLCCEDVSCAIKVFGAELLLFDGATPLNEHISIDIEVGRGKNSLFVTRNDTMNDVLAEIGEYGKNDANGNIVREFPQLYEDFKNMMVKVGYRVDKDL